LYLAEGGDSIKQLDKKNILSLQAQSELSDGYIIIAVDKLGVFVAMDRD